MKDYIRRQRIRVPRKRNQIVDVVCGMRINLAATPHSTHHNSGATYYFCSSTCKQQFEASPWAYLGNKENYDESQQ